MTTTPANTSGDDADLRLAAGRAKAIEKMPYLSTALMACKPVRSPGIGTIAIDKRWRVYWEPDLVRASSVDEVAGMWLHEVGHPLREHSERFDVMHEPKSRHKIWNSAGDAAINADLRECGVSLPKFKVYYPERIPGATRDMTTEQMYRLLLATPEAEKLDLDKPEMAIAPNKVRYDYTDGFTVLAATRSAIVDANVTAEIMDLSQGLPVPVPGAVKSVKAVSDRLAEITLAAGIKVGQYQVSLSSGAGAATAPIEIIYPSISMRPDHVERGYAAPYNTVVEGHETRFDEHTVVEILDPATQAPIAGAATNVEAINPGLIRFDLPLLPDGVYPVRVTAGAEVCQTVLPVGMPFLDLNPPQLVLGYGTPYPMAGVGSDIAFDANSTITVTDMDGNAQVNATSAPTVLTPTSINFTMTESLPAGQYIVQVTGGPDTAVAFLTVVPPQGGGSGEGEGDGEGEGEGEGDGGGDGEGGFAPSDCGSGSGGGKRPWDKDASEDGDGSIDEGRGETIRAMTAKAIKEHSKNRGNVPAGWERWADSILDPQVDWRKELDAVARRTTALVAGRKDYSYQRPSRRSSAMPGVVLPGMRQPRPPVVDCIVDTSGSMSDGDLAQVLGEIAAIVDRVSKRGSTLRVRSCDAATAKSSKIKDVKHITLVGGGGTDMRIGIKAAAEERPKSDLIITLTDGETPWPTEPDPANPSARYVAVLVRGEASYSEVPDFMHKIVINGDFLTQAP